jgi:hypothetical protein
MDLEEMQKQVLGLMKGVEKYKKYAETKTIMLNLATVSRELNNITLKEIIGDEEENRILQKP